MAGGGGGRATSGGGAGEARARGSVRGAPSPRAPASLGPGSAPALGRARGGSPDRRGRGVRARRVPGGGGPALPAHRARCPPAPGDQRAAGLILVSGRARGRALVTPGLLAWVTPAAPGLAGASRPGTRHAGLLIAPSVTPRAAGAVVEAGRIVRRPFRCAGVHVGPISVHAGAAVRVSDSLGARRMVAAGVLEECSFAHVHAPHSASEAPAEGEPGLAASSAPPVQLAPAAETFAVAAPLVHETVEFRRLLTRAFLVPAILLALLAVALGGGVALLVRQARLTQRSDQVLAQSARLRELLVDRET